MRRDIPYIQSLIVQCVESIFILYFIPAPGYLLQPPRDRPRQMTLQYSKNDDLRPDGRARQDANASRRRRATAPRPPKPTIINAQVPGPGTTAERARSA